MPTESEAERYLAEFNERVRILGRAAHGVLDGLGSSSYVKTIYIGYDIDGEMVAALYAHADHLEVALALPEDAEEPILVDASHLTWRTLPVAAIVRSGADLEAFAELARSAVERVRNQKHDVMRDNEFFVRSRRERRERGDDE